MSTSPQPPPPYRQLVGGDVFSTVDPSQPDQLQVDAGFVLAGWRPRPPRVPSRPAFPGTAVWAQERWFEVVRMERGSAGSRVIYHLEIWESNQPIRAPQELTPEACERATAAHRLELRRARKAKRAGWMIFFVGLLPREEQQRLELEYGIRPAVGSLASAAVLCSGSIATMLLIFGRSQGLPMSPSLARYADAALLFSPFLLYLIVESLFRINSALSGEPLGSFLVAGPYTLIQRLFNARPGQRRPSLPPAPRAIRGSGHRWLEAQDRVQPLGPDADGKHRLEIRSLLPKEHWRAHIHAIDWQGRRYTLEERTQDPSNELSYGFMLEEADEDVLFRDLHTYDPNEVREVYRAQKRLSVGSWVKSFGLLWGYTDPKLQETLAEIYGYHPWRNTKGSIHFSLFFALLMLAIGAHRMAQGSAIPGDALVLLFFLAVLWDAVVRFVRLREGELTESFLGPALAPLVRPALRWRAAPHWRYPDEG